jgi:hypothetical protein
MPAEVTHNPFYRNSASLLLSYGYAGRALSPKIAEGAAAR